MHNLSRVPLDPDQAGGTVRRYRLQTPLAAFVCEEDAAQHEFGALITRSFVGSRVTTGLLREFARLRYAPGTDFGSSETGVSTCAALAPERPRKSDEPIVARLVVSHTVTGWSDANNDTRPGSRDH